MTNSFIKVAGYKINKQNPQVFLYKNNEQAKKEMRKTIQFKIVPKKVKYLTSDIMSSTMKNINHRRKKRD
jgi:hypothetical protein